MEVSQKLKVGATEFFDALASSVAYDIAQATAKEISPEQIHSGFCYKKRMKNKVGQKSYVDVVIKQFVAPVCYEADFRTSQGTNVISYKIEESNDGNIVVHYRESFEGENTLGALNYKIVSWLYNKSTKRRISRLLSSMESYIHAKETLKK